MRKRPTLNADIANIALAWVLSRACVWVFVMLGHIGMRSLPHPWPSESKGSWVGVESFWLNPWTLFDSAHYINIAKDGYVAFQSAFFPLYPVLIRILGGPHASDNTLALVGILISNIAFAGSLWLLFLLTRDEWGEKIARRAVWIEAFFPATAFGAAVYTESLFLFLSLAFFWMARQKRWFLSGIFGFLVGMTRNSGPILCLALLFDRPKEPLTKTEKRARAVSAVAPLLGSIGFQFLMWTQFREESSTLVTQKMFGRVPTFPLVPVWLDLKSLFVDPTKWLDFVTVPQLGATIGAFTLVWVYRRRFSPGKLLYLVAVLLANLTLSWEHSPHTNSTLRFLFGTFPTAQLLALFSIEKIPAGFATLCLATAGLMLLFLQSYMFGYKGFLG